MAPTPWATLEQTTWLQGWLPDYMRRQAEQQLSMFWAPMFNAWFKQFPEHPRLDLPLPSDPGARKLTDAELTTLGAAIHGKKKQLENWFRYQRKKVASTESVAGANAAPTVKKLFKFNVPKRRRAHQPIEIFQRRNREAIAARLTTEGYELLKAESNDEDGDEDGKLNVREEDSLGKQDRIKDLRSQRMRLRIRVVKTMFGEASEAELAAIQEEVQRESDELHAEAEEAEKEVGSTEPKATQAKEFQDGIDALETVYSQIHKATYNACGWVGMTILGGPNPRIGGELSVKIFCFGKSAAGNDFEDACVDFDKSVTEPFGEWLAAAQRVSRALPAKSSERQEPLPARCEQTAPAPAGDGQKTKKPKARKSQKTKKSPAAVQDESEDSAEPMGPVSAPSDGGKNTSLSTDPLSTWDVSTMAGETIMPVPEAPVVPLLSEADNETLDAFLLNADVDFNDLCDMDEFGTTTDVGSGQWLHRVAAELRADAPAPSLLLPGMTAPPKRPSWALPLDSLSPAAPVYHPLLNVSNSISASARSSSPPSRSLIRAPSTPTTPAPSTSSTAPSSISMSRPQPRGNYAGARREPGMTALLKSPSWPLPLNSPSSGPQPAPVYPALLNVGNSFSASAGSSSPPSSSPIHAPSTPSSPAPSSPSTASSSNRTPSSSSISMSCARPQPRGNYAGARRETPPVVETVEVGGYNFPVQHFPPPSTLFQAFHSSPLQPRPTLSASLKPSLSRWPQSSSTSPRKPFQQRAAQALTELLREDSPTVSFAQLPASAPPKAASSDLAMPIPLQTQPTTQNTPTVILTAPAPPASPTAPVVNTAPSTTASHPPTLIRAVPDPTDVTPRICTPDTSSTAQAASDLPTLRDRNKSPPYAPVAAVSALPSVRPSPLDWVAPTCRPAVQPPPERKKALTSKTAAKGGAKLAAVKDTTARRPAVAVKAAGGDHAGPRKPTAPLANTTNQDHVATSAAPPGRLSAAKPGMAPPDVSACDGAADASASEPPKYIFTIGNVNGKYARAAAKEKREREEREKAEEMQKQAARGWLERVDQGHNTVILTRARKPPRMPDGSVYQPSTKARARPNPHAKTEAILLSRSKRKADEETAGPSKKRRTK